MNELPFFLHALAVAAFVLIALRQGKSALIAMAALQAVLANLFIVKQISLFGFAVTCSDAFAVGGILTLNLLQEYFGKEAAKQAARISLLTLFFFAVMSQIHLVYLPTQSDTTQEAFLSIFSSSPRIIGASVAVFYLVQQFDVRFFSFLKGKLALRVGISLVCSQLLDTVLFSFLGLYGLVESVFDIILVSFAVKCVLVAVSVPFVAFSKRLVRSGFPV